MKNISDRLKEFAKYIGSARRLSELIGLKPTAFQIYTNGRSLPGALILTKLSELGCNINWLLTGEGNMLIVKNEKLDYDSDLFVENEKLKIENETLMRVIERLKMGDCEDDKKGAVRRAKQNIPVPIPMPENVPVLDK